MCGLRGVKSQFKANSVFVSKKDKNKARVDLYYNSTFTGSEKIPLEDDLELIRITLNGLLCDFTCRSFNGCL